MKIKSNFLKLIRQKNSVLTEQDLPAPPPPAPAPGTEVVDQEQIKVDIKEPEKERFKELTPEGEVELIRLIRKALVLEPTEGTIPPVILDDEINEENGREMLSKMKNFMNTFSDDPDINVEVVDQTGAAGSFNL